MSMPCLDERPQVVNVSDWLRRSNARSHQPILHFDQFWDDAMLIRLFDGPTPRGRRDFHVNTCAEFFYQLQGDLTTVLFQGGEFITEVCRAGEMFWIPPLVPHLNIRQPGSAGLVIHGQRQPGAKDAMVWYCEPCKLELYRVEYAFEKDLPKLLAPMIREFLSDESRRTCSCCQRVLPGDLGFL